MKELFHKLGLSEKNMGTIGASPSIPGSGQWLKSFSPINDKLIAEIEVTSDAGYERVVAEARETFERWRLVPAPKRGEIVRQVGNALRGLKSELGILVTLECGKILAEGEGEIQEAIDIADFAVGLSRQLYGLTMHSERPAHRMYEQWHPLGICGVISAFNFPAAVWAWNAMLAAVCGDVVIWKPSEHTPLTALAMNQICRKVAQAHGFPGLFSLIIGDGPQLGKRMADDARIPLISATGSCRMGRSVGESVAKRLGRSILELGGNNAIVVLADADLKLTIPAVLFGAVGTAGQRCTSTRRILIEKSIEPEFTKRLIEAYKQVKIGDPLVAGTLMGPLVNNGAIDAYNHALKAVAEQGGRILYGGKVLSDMPSNKYVAPTIVLANSSMAIVREETFAPILYIIPVENLEEALKIHNDVPQGLSSAIFTKNLQMAERFLSQAGSDCGIANVNIGTSGAEIGGAFGGEKDTGGGRESGSDSWRQYMRRQTNTINYSNELPLAQGIKFG
jgi:aldehyde dehydrogenase (NAD+)